MSSTLKIVLPWRLLIPDNEKYTINKHTGRPILTTKYRKAKDQAHLLALSQTERKKLAGTLMLHAMMYEPDRERLRDLSNYCKIVHDALEGAAYTKDSQLDGVVWIRAGIDELQPRLEITIATVASLWDLGILDRLILPPLTNCSTATDPVR